MEAISIEFWSNVNMYDLNEIAELHVKWDYNQWVLEKVLKVPKRVLVYFGIF